MRGDQENSWASLSPEIGATLNDIREDILRTKKFINGQAFGPRIHPEVYEITLAGFADQEITPRLLELYVMLLQHYASRTEDTMAACTQAAVKIFMTLRSDDVIPRRSGSGGVEARRSSAPVEPAYGPPASVEQNPWQPAEPIPYKRAKGRARRPARTKRKSPPPKVEVWPREITICGSYLRREAAKPHRVPDLRLKGQWLAETIFRIGKRVAISYADGKLIIELAKVQPRWAK